MRRALALALAAAALPAAADSLQFTAQNDSGFATDRAYTSGVGLSWLRAPRAPGERAWELGLAQQIFTPDTREDPSARLERPYAARLVLFGACHAAGEGRLDTLAASVGVTGPSALGKQAQQLFHHVISSPATDWSRQLHDRLDAGVQGTLSRTLWSAQSTGASLAGHAGGQLGNVLGFAHAGLEARWGAAAAPWSEPLRYAPTPIGDAGRAHGFSAFAGASYRYVFRNELLERNAGDPGRTLDREASVRRLALGAGWAARWGALTFTLVQEAREYTRQPYLTRYWSLGLAMPLE